MLYQATATGATSTIAGFDPHPTFCPNQDCPPFSAVPVTFDGTARVSVVNGAVYVLVTDRPSGVGRLVVLR